MLDVLISLLWNLFWYLALVLGLLSLGTMIIHQIIQLVLLHVFPAKNFKRDYGDWALVTGASSGIGKAIAARLASQGVNVVIVGLPDKMLSETITELRDKYPSVTFRECPCNLGATDPREYMDKIIEATRDIEVRIVFNNAAFINFGFFLDIDIERMRANMICNASSSIEITHHFGKLMLFMKPNPVSKKKGIVCFTSSCGSYLASPTAMLYGPTKAFLSNFGASFAAENYDTNIDTLVVHPGPVATNFYKHSAGMPTIEATAKVAVGAEAVVDCFFAGAGRVCVFEQGSLTVGFKILTKILDFPVLCETFKRFAYMFPDHQVCVKKSKMRQQEK